MSNPERHFARRWLCAAMCVLVGLGSIGCEVARETHDRFGDNSPGRNGRLLVDESSADNRRLGMLYLVDRPYGRKAPYTTRYQVMALQDADPLVRATAIRSLNRSRDASATKVFITALNDSSPQVRLEAVKALYRLPDPNSVGTLLAMVDTEHDEDRDVRIAAAEALEHYRRFDVGRALVNLLDAKDFGLAWQARRSLKYLTGKDLEYDESAWLEFIAGPTKPLG